jgi:hypothetical protein
LYVKRTRFPSAIAREREKKKTEGLSGYTLNVVGVFQKEGKCVDFDYLYLIVGGS